MRIRWNLPVSKQVDVESSATDIKRIDQARDRPIKIVRNRTDFAEARACCPGPCNFEVGDVQPEVAPLLCHAAEVSIDFVGSKVGGGPFA